MFKVYLRKHEEHVIVLILGPNASEDEVNKWANGAPFEGPSEYTSMSGALESARQRSPTVWNVRDPGGIGEINQTDIDRLIKPN